MILRTILIAIAVGLEIYVFYAIKNGKIHIKGKRYSMRKNTVMFWISVVIYSLFSLLLLYFAIWGNIKSG